jgi:copper transport protein
VRRILLASLVLLGTEAGAHANLMSSTPADGAVLATAPERIELRFNEPMRPIAVRLFDGTGKPLALAPVQTDGALLRITVPEKLADGHYTLSYRVTSLDSHPVSGSIVFGIGGSAPVHGALSKQPSDLFRIVVRALRDLGLLVAAGGALFSLLMRSFPGDAAIVRSAALAAAAASVFAIGLQGGALLGESPLSVDAWRVGLQSSFGISACLAIAGLLGVASLRPTLMIAGASAALASLALTGHTLSAHPPWIPMTALAAHALAAAFWAGSLVGLYFILSRQPLRAAGALRRFSPTGMVAVAVLLAGGVVLAVLQLHGPWDLATSAYGRYIAAKAVLLALLILLALVNRYRLLPMLERGAGQAQLQLRRTIGLELALLTSVVAVTAFLVQTPPPERSQERSLVNGPHKAALSVAPGQPGPNVISVRLTGAQEVSIEMQNAAARMEPIVRPMRRIAADVYRYEGPELAFPGAWDLTVHARIGEFDKISFNARVMLR